MTATVLLIGTNVNERIITQTLLALRGHTVMSAASVSDARAVLARHPVVVAVVDLDTVPASSLADLRALRRSPVAGGGLPFAHLVATTAREEPELESVARAAGAAALFRRPGSTAALLEAIERVAAPPPR